MIHDCVGRLSTIDKHMTSIECEYFSNRHLKELSAFIYSLLTLHCVPNFLICSTCLFGYYILLKNSHRFNQHVFSMCSFQREWQPQSYGKKVVFQHRVFSAFCGCTVWNNSLNHSQRYSSTKASMLITLGECIQAHSNRATYEMYFFFRRLVC